MPIEEKRISSVYNLALACMLNYRQVFQEAQKEGVRSREVRPRTVSSDSGFCAIVRGELISLSLQTDYVTDYVTLLLFVLQAPCSRP